MDIIFSVLGALAVIFALLFGAGSSGAGSSGDPAPTTTTKPATPTTPPTTTTTPKPVVLKVQFVYGVLTLKDRRIEITGSKVIPAGAEGNKYGDKPVLEIWYNTTNLGTTEATISQSHFIWYFNAYQDSDPNLRNELEIESHPDSALAGERYAEIKPGGTVAGAIAYELTDLTTPVELFATDSIIFGKDLGRMIFDVK